MAVLRFRQEILPNLLTMLFPIRGLFLCLDKCLVPRRRCGRLQYPKTMEPRFTRGEYWLLETAVEYGAGLCFLREAGDEFSHQYNKAGHGLDRSSLVATLQRLHAAGLIQFRMHDDVGETTLVELSAAEIDIALDEGEHRRTGYRLTFEGGAQWEAFARPRWDRFVHLKTYYTDDDPPRPKRAEFRCMDLKRLKTVVQYHSLCVQPIELDAVQYSELPEWSPTYWKVLPAGFRAIVRFSGREWSSRWNGTRLSKIIHTKLLADDLMFAGYCRFRDSWYQWQ